VGSAGGEGEGSGFGDRRVAFHGGLLLVVARVSRGVGASVGGERRDVEEAGGTGGGGGAIGAGPARSNATGAVDFAD
jgi:hypothetical protein